LLGSGKYKEAIQAFDRCQELGLADAPVFQGRALAKARLGEFRSAVDDYNQALAKERDPYSLTGRGWVHVASGSLQIALVDFTEAVKLESGNSYARSGRGYVLARLGQYQTAVIEAEESVRLGPKAPGLQHNAARTYALAVARLDAELQATRQILETRFKYQVRALELLRLALEALPADQRKAFWNNSIARDPDLKSIRRSPGYINLETEYGRAGD
jgi:tetratricopeptide (TPR) repeat protein